MVLVAADDDDAHQACVEVVRAVQVDLPDVHEFVAQAAELVLALRSCPGHVVGQDGDGFAAVVDAMGLDPPAAPDPGGSAEAVPPVAQGRGDDVTQGRHHCGASVRGPVGAGVPASHCGPGV